MKRYLVFAWGNSYSEYGRSDFLGGWDDFIAAEATLGRARLRAKAIVPGPEYDHYQIVDLESEKIIEHDRYK